MPFCAVAVAVASSSLASEARRIAIFTPVALVVGARERRVAPVSLAHSHGRERCVPSAPEPVKIVTCVAYRGEVCGDVSKMTDCAERALCRPRCRGDTLGARPADSAACHWLELSRQAGVALASSGTSGNAAGRAVVANR
eukprot:6190780-Pleurochrysis_carterae.AAC.3